jgi:hypothetical protein
MVTEKKIPGAFTITGLKKKKTNTNWSKNTLLVIIYKNQDVYYSVVDFFKL